MFSTIPRKKSLVTPRSKLTRAKNSSATTTNASSVSSKLPNTPAVIKFTPRTPVYNFTSADMRQLEKDFNSPSASRRIRAVNALKAPTRSRYSVFDAGEDLKVTEDEQKAAEPAKPRTIQDVMKTVVAYVEVRGDGEDRSAGIMKVVAALGAQVNSTLLKNTTHVIFKDAKLSTYQKAKKLNIPMVSVLWIEACKRHLGLMDPNDYPIANLHRYENPERYKQIRCAKPLFTQKDLELTPTMSSAISRPLSFKTPVADSLRHEMRELSKKIEETEVAQTPKTPAPQPLPPTKCLTEPPKSILTSKMLLTAMKNMESLKESPAKKENSIIDLTDTPEKQPDVTVKSTNRRRTLFTPNPAYDETSVIAAAKQDRRRTINPFAVKKIETVPEKRRRTIFTPNPKYDTTPTLGKTSVTPSINRRRTLFNPATLASAVLDTPTPKAPQSTQKRKLFVEPLKENTPPPTKVNPFFTPQHAKFNAKPPAELSVVQSQAKRRRTLWSPAVQFAL